MMTLPELWKHFKWLSDPEGYTKEERVFLVRFLAEEYRLREQKKQEHLLRMSGIKRVKLLTDFDWTFNPKLPREKLMEFMATDWLKKPLQSHPGRPSRGREVPCRECPLL